MNTKQCMACKEAILTDALKCKYCRQIQTKAANLHNRPAYNYLVLGIVGIFILWAFYSLYSFFSREPLEPNFEIASSNLLLTDVDNVLNIRCIGEIKNPTPQRWSEFSLQATFKDANEIIIDVLYSKPDVTIYPFFSFEGIVSGDGSAAKGDYNSCVLSVVNADDH